MTFAELTYILPVLPVQSWQAVDGGERASASGAVPGPEKQTSEPSNLV